MTGQTIKKPAEALLLDFGSVVTLTMFETHRMSERSLGLPEGSLTWMGPFDPEQDELWSAMQRDEMTERDYWLARTKEVGKLLGEDWTEMSQFVRRARGKNPHEIIRPEMPMLIDAVKKAGKKLAILSNELDLFFGKDLREQLGFLKDFDVITDATYTRILKPKPEAYQLCLDELGLKPEECVFIDDQMRNVKGGNAVGIQALHLDVFNPQDVFNEALKRLGIDLRFSNPGNPTHSKLDGECV
jgi:putative hydrolase of the HAD superfamily